MIIIKIIFLYFIEMAHTDDFPSTGTRLVIIIVATSAALKSLGARIQEQQTRMKNRNRKPGTGTGEGLQ